MQLDRHAVMAARMPEARGDRALVVAPLADFDPRSLAAERAPAVGGDHERRLDRGAVGAIEPRLGAIQRDARHARWDDGGELDLRSGVERLDQSGIGDVVAEGGKGELARPELDVGRADEAPRDVDDADRLEWCCVRGKLLEHPERLQQIDRARKQRRSARFAGRSARFCRRRSNQSDLGPDMGERERGGDAGRTCPDHRGIAGKRSTGGVNSLAHSEP